MSSLKLSVKFFCEAWQQGLYLGTVFLLELLKMIVAAATKAFRPRGNSIDLYFAWRDLGLHIMFWLKANEVKFRK